MSKYFAFAASNDDDAAHLEESYQQWCKQELNAPKIDHRWLCRVCLESGEEMENMFPNNDDDDDDDDDDPSLAKQINQCSDIPLISRNDGFPQYICGACKRMLTVAIEFRGLCKMSDTEMRTMDHIKLEEETEFDKEIPTIEQHQHFSDNDHADAEYLEETVEEASESETTEPSVDMSPQFTQTEVVVGGNPKDKSKPSISQHAIHQCEVCNWVFKTAFNLKRHMRNHLSNLPFECPICSHSYRKESGLRTHMATHSVERKFCCETCGKTFKTQAVAYKHRLSHGNGTKFPCPECPYQAGSKANLEIHQRIHSGLRPYKCQECPRTFSTSSNRLKHYRCVHEKKKAIGCTECDKRFSTNEAMKKHMLVHIGGKPHSCPYCALPYRYRKNVRAHLRKHHADRLQSTKPSNMK